MEILFLSTKFLFNTDTSVWTKKNYTRPICDRNRKSEIQTTQGLAPSIEPNWAGFNLRPETDSSPRNEVFK
jgi:hypothetical protein